VIIYAFTLVMGHMF